jgi:hypothetical protein
LCDVWGRLQVVLEVALPAMRERPGERALRSPAVQALPVYLQ